MTQTFPRRIALRAGALILAALLLIPCPAQALDTSDCVRLHIIADDDSAYKQAAKLAVRDCVREAAAALCEDCTDAQSAFEMLAQNLDTLKSAAQEALNDWDLDDSVTLEAGVFTFPERHYGDTMLPEGDYRAIRVVLGRGTGHNWWCVLYPDLCVNADDDGVVVFYSALGRWLQSLWQEVFS